MLGCLAISIPAARASSRVTVEDGRIVFDSTRDGGDRDVFIAGPDGSSPVNLTADSPADDHDAVISDNGERIVFVSDRAGGDSDVFVMRGDGSNPVNLTTGSASEDIDPIISGKLRRWVFFASNRDGDYDVFSIKSDGRGLQGNWSVEATPPSNETAPWVYSHGIGGGPLMTTDRFGGDLDILYQGYNGTSDSDGDDTNLGGYVTRPVTEQVRFDADVFQSDRDGDADIYVDDDATIDLLNAENMTPGASGFDGEPWVSPTRERIAFTSDRDGGDRDVFSMSADGSGPVNLTSGSGATDQAPSWEAVYRCAGRRITRLGSFGYPGNEPEPRGTRRDDVMYGWSIRGGRGDDLICTDHDARGDDGNDRIYGWRGRDRELGGAGKDRLVGGQGRDDLYGGPGRDLLVGGEGDDLCVGGPGRDRMIGCESRR